MKDDLFYVEHILECIEKIDKFSRGGEAEFLGSELIQDAVLRNLQILAESTKRLTEAVKAATPSIQWSAVIGFRSVLVHEYLGLNLESVWRIVVLDLPTLRKHLTEVHQRLVSGGQ